MAVFAISDRGVATAAAADQAIAGLWNPHATLHVKLFYYNLSTVAAPGAAGGFALRRTTARGTTNPKVPAISNDFDRELVSGTLFDNAYSVQPTLEAGALYRWYFSTEVRHALYATLLQPIEIPPGSGVAMVTTDAAAFATNDISFAWEE